MKTRVIYIGNAEMVDYPFIVNDDWLIPRNWYLLGDELQNRPNIVSIKNRKFVIIEHVQINYNLDGEEYRLSVIKTDENLNIGDIITYR